MHFLSPIALNLDLISSLIVKIVVQLTAQNTTLRYPPTPRALQIKTRV